MKTVTTEAKLTPKLLEKLENIRKLSKEEQNIIKDVEWGLHG